MERQFLYDGININYFDNENFNKPVIIMLHGWGQNYQCFNDIINKLNANYHIYALDLPGFGKSDEPLTPYTIYDYEQMLASFIKKYNCKQVILLAHSFGGRISIIYSAKHPQMVSKLILTGAAGIKPQATISQKLKVFHYKFLKLLTKTFLFKQWREDLLTNSGSVDYQNASVMMKKVLINTVNADLLPLLNKITTPTLLYWGVDDDQTPITDAYTMEKLINDTHLKAVAHHGHFAFLTNKNDFYKEVKRFLEK